MIFITILFIILFAIFGYLIGSIFISYPWALLKGVDITKSGTGQLGGSNAGRLLGWYAMILAGLFDVLKSFITLVLIDYFLKNILINIDQLDIKVSLIAGSVGVLLGHAYSLYIKLYSKEWHGGKGFASFGGIMLFISWPTFIILFIGLFGFLQLLRKKVKANSTIYDNFLSNAVLLLVAPFIIYIFDPQVWLTLWMIIIIIVLALLDKEKVFNIFLNLKEKIHPNMT